MKTYIEHHYGESDDEVLKILKDHPELWGDISFSIYFLFNWVSTSVQNRKTRQRNTLGT